jgi:hypothetical protein
MAKYSYYCARCGFTFQSDDKREVADARKRHNLKKSMTKRMPNGDLVLTGNHSCGLRHTIDGTATRPGLVDVVETLSRIKQAGGKT